MSIGIGVSDRESKVCVMTKEDGDRKLIVETLEFAVVVANPAEVKLITDSNAKNDKSDARKLARLALADVELIKPVKLRDERHQQMLRYHESRLLLWHCRNAMISQMRSFAKSCGFRLPECNSDWFHEIDRSEWPYFGQVPKTSQSGESDPQLGMTKAGNELVRTVLTECAHVVMKSSAKDTDLKLKGLRISAHGGKIARKKFSLPLHGFAHVDTYMRLAPFS